MRSFTLLLQMAGITLIAPSWGFPAHGTKTHPITGQVPTFLENDYFLAQATTEKPLRIIAAEQKPSETREEFLVRKQLQEEELHRQAKSAKYSFASSLSDRIMDGEHIRTETRDGLKTTGSYTYSDGYVRRTVAYEADENGFRVVKQTEEQIGDGPQPDPTGGADVAAYYDRSKLQYSITADDIRGHYTEEEQEDEDEVTTKFPFLASFQRNLAPKPTTPAPVTVIRPATIPGSGPIPTFNHFSSEQIPVHRPVERHDIQTPLRPSPHLRGQYFTQVHSL